MYLYSVLAVSATAVLVANAQDAPLPQGATGTYQPAFVPCPAAPIVRPAKGLSKNETAWLARREPNVVEGLDRYLCNVNIPGFDNKKYIKKLKQHKSKCKVSCLCIEDYSKVR